MSEEPKKATAFALTFPDGKPVIMIGTGNHDCVRFELNWAQVATFVMDALPRIVRR